MTRHDDLLTNKQGGFETMPRVNSVGLSQTTACLFGRSGEATAKWYEQRLRQSRSHGLHPHIGAYHHTIGDPICLLRSKLGKALPSAENVIAHVQRSFCCHHTPAVVPENFVDVHLVGDAERV
jgi:hypothetical protein